MDHETMACEGLSCPFKGNCKRYQMHLRNRELKKYAFYIITQLTDKVCLDIIKY
jgi:hypothetical protein